MWKKDFLVILRNAELQLFKINPQFSWKQTDWNLIATVTDALVETIYDDQRGLQLQVCCQHEWPPPRPPDLWPAAVIKDKWMNVYLDRGRKLIQSCGISSSPHLSTWTETLWLKWIINVQGAWLERVGGATSEAKVLWMSPGLKKNKTKKTMTSPNTGGGDEPKTLHD